MNRPLLLVRRTNRETRMESWVECGCGYGIDSPATPLPKAITALNHSAITPQPPAEALKRLTRLDETRKSDQSNKGGKKGFFPHRPRFDIPHPLSFGTMPFSFQRCTAVAGCGFSLFNVRVFMMPNYNVPYSMTYHRQLSLLPKHTKPNRWWGFFL